MSTDDCACTVLVSNTNQSDAVDVFRDLDDFCLSNLFTYTCNALKHDHHASLIVNANCYVSDDLFERDTSAILNVDSALSCALFDSASVSVTDIQSCGNLSSMLMVRESNENNFIDVDSDDLFINRPVKSASSNIQLCVDVHVSAVLDALYSNDCCSVNEITVKPDAIVLGSTSVCPDDVINKIHFVNQGNEQSCSTNIFENGFIPTFPEELRGKASENFDFGNGNQISDSRYLKNGASNFCPDKDPQKNVSNFHGEPKEGDFKHALIGALDDLIASAENMLSFDQECLNDNLKLDRSPDSVNKRQNDVNTIYNLLVANEDMPNIKSCDRFNYSDISRNMCEQEDYSSFSIFHDANYLLPNTSVNNTKQLNDTEFLVRNVNAVNACTCTLENSSSIKIVAGDRDASLSSDRPDVSICITQVSNTIDIGQCNRPSRSVARVESFSQLASGRIVPCRNELDDDCFDILKQNLRIGIVCKRTVTKHAECCICAGFENHFGQMCLGQINSSLEVEERFAAFLSDDNEICLSDRISVICVRICVIWDLSRIWHACHVCTYLTVRGFARLVFDRGKFIVLLQNSTLGLTVKRTDGFPWNIIGLVE